MRDRRIPGSGFTLVELLIALGIGMVVVGACYEFMFRARRTADEGLTLSILDTGANDLIQRITELLRQASITSPDWDLAPGGSSVTYNLCEGAEGSAIIWGPATTLAALPTEGAEGAEGDDGSDNDGDGLVDERQLVIQDADTGTILETWAVDLQSLLILQDGRILAVTVALQAPAPQPGVPPGTASASTSVSTRN